MHELRVLDTSERQSDAWIEECSVDAVGIHIGDSCVRVEATLAALVVGHCIVANYPITRADRAECAKPPASAKRLAIDAQAFLAVLVDEEARCAIPKRRIDIILPEVDRLEDVAVGIDGMVSRIHNQLLSGRWRGRDQTPVWLLGRYAGDSGVSTLERFNAKLTGGVPPHHFCYQSFGDIGAREHRDRVPG